MGAHREQGHGYGGGLSSRDAGGLHRKLSAFVPSLPSFKKLRNVDLAQVINVSVLFWVLLGFGMLQLLLDVRTLIFKIAYVREVVGL